MNDGKVVRLVYLLPNLIRQHIIDIKFNFIFL